MTHKKYPYRYAPKQISYTHIRIYCNEKDVELNSKANRGKQKQHKTTSKKGRKKKCYAQNRREKNRCTSIFLDVIQLSSSSVFFFFF